MTTAARPTFDPARGGQGRGEKDLSAISRQYSSRDLPGHTKLKYREPGQGTTDELRQRDFRKELDEREKDVKAPGARRQNEPPVKRFKIDQVPAASLDADDPLEGDSSDSDDSDDDTAALLAELNKIKKERAIEQAKKEAEKKQEEERIRMENILSGNPLLNYSAAGQKNDLKVKRRWDDDVVFKNCARSEPEKKANTFINDSLRSGFHKKFMENFRTNTERLESMSPAARKLAAKHLLLSPRARLTPNAVGVLPHTTPKRTPTPRTPLVAPPKPPAPAPAPLDTPTDNITDNLLQINVSKRERLKAHDFFK